jgi:hypothetical protein
MPIQFASYPATQHSSYNLSGPERELILDLLANTPRRQVYLFVLDSGWPTAKEYDFSRRETLKMFDSVRQAWKLPAKKRGTGLPPFTDPSNKHCQEVMTALSAFQNLDLTTHRVPIIYFPVTLEQDSKPVLQELLELAYVKDKMGPGIGDSPPPRDVLRDALGYAQDVLKTLPKDACVPKTNGVCSRQVHTNKAILEALWILGDAITETSSARPVYFINESWTVANDSLNPRVPGRPHGIAVVAAGNNGTTVNSDSDGVDFARQCFPARVVLAVLYVTAGKGLQCKSSKVKEEKTVLANTMATAFDGSIPDNCGTSFASPRVAWLLALAEAYRTYEIDRTQWASDVQRRLVSTRSSAPGLESLIFDLQQYIRRSLLTQPN